MILTGFAVFLFGTAVSAGPLIPHVKAPAEIVISKHSSADKVTEYYPSSGGSLITNYIQKGTNVFFKPQFMLSAAQMPPQVQAVIAAIEKDDCKTNLPMGPISMLLEEPLQIVQKEMIASSKPIIKEVIEINPEKYYQYVQPSIELSPAAPPAMEMHVLELPKTPTFVEETSELGTPSLTGEEHIIIPEAPLLSPYMPSFMIEADKPGDIITELVIPPAPEFPAMELPKLSVSIEKMPLNTVELVPETPSIVEIPPAPVLQPFEMPSLPVLIEEPEKEIVEVSVKPQEIPELTVVPSLIPEVYVREVEVSPPEAPVLPPLAEIIEENSVTMPIDIPAAPMLPPFEMPKLSVVVEEARCAPEIEVNEIKPVEIPEAPVLPPYVSGLPEILVAEKPIVTQSSPIIIEEKPMLIPEAPLLPPLSLPELPMRVEVSKNVVVPSETVEVVEPFLIPEAPVLSPYIPVNASITVEEPVSVIVENEISKLFAVPAPPVLPPFTMPEITVTTEESKENFLPPLVSEIIVPPPSPIIIEEKPMIIPEAPILPPLSLPELPRRVEVSKNVVVPSETVEVVEPLVIPEAPVLSPYIPVDAPIIVEEPVSVKVENEISKPFAVPAPPELSPFEVPELPVIIEESNKMPVTPQLFSEAIISPTSPVIIEENPMLIPEAPILPPFSLPVLSEKVVPCDTVEVMEPFMIPDTVLNSFIPVKLPTPVLVQEAVQKSIEIPSAPVLPAMELNKAPVIIEEVVPCLTNNELEHPKVVVQSRPIVMEVPYAFKETYLAKNGELKPNFLVTAGGQIKEEPCVLDIVVERILSKLDKTLRPAPGKVPVSPYLTPIPHAMF